ncbi:MAG: type II secretion system protein GspL [Halieaceae bacterium]|jgi:type II secretion system protein L|nr:type II secretion system protein GspL [Halieaceae bacterium]
MSENRSVLALRDGGLVWLRSDAPARSLDDAAAREALRAEVARRDHRVLFAAPGSELRLIDLPVKPEERRHLDASLPFMLEESFTEDIDALHFARLMLDRQRCAVAVASHSAMRDWLDALGEFAERVPWLPEPLLLPGSDEEWTLLVDGDSALLRWGLCQGTRIEARHLPALLAGLLASRPLPERLVVYGADEALDRGLLPAELDALAQWRRGDLAAAMLLAAGEPLLDLRQGPYAQQLPYTRWWRQWRAVAGLAAAALALHLASGWLDLQRLERQNLALRGEVEALYRSVNPRGALVDAERQLDRQLAALRGGGEGGSFTALLSPVAAGMAAADGLRLASLNYSRGRGELRLNVLAPDFASVETLRTTLTGRGLDATLESSSRSGDRVRARLRVGTSP